MNWFTSLPPKIRSFLKRSESPKDFWIKCPATGQLVPRLEVEENLFVIPTSDYHLQMTPKERFRSLFDDASWEKIPIPEVSLDPLKFRDKKRYRDRVKAVRAETGGPDAIALAHGKVEGISMVIAVHDFRFVGGTLGIAAGEAILKGVEVAIARRAPFIVFTASGGARLQEGIFALMQLPRTTIAIEMLREAKLPYFVVLANPTMGGVTASYAMLGDVHIAEPGAVIGFAGQRVITSTTGERNFPPGFQTAEYMLARGMVDMVVHRHKLRSTIARLSRLLMRTPAPATAVAA